MPSVAVTGDDTVKINGRILADLGDGDVGALTHPNDIANVKTGKNGNSVYALNESGKQSDFVIRVIRGSADDKFLNSLLALQQNNFAGFVHMIGELVKRIGDGTGKVLDDQYLMSGGVFQKRVEAKSNTDGETDQSVAVYSFKFANAPRIIG